MISNVFQAIQLYYKIIFVESRDVTVCLNAKWHVVKTFFTKKFERQLFTSCHLSPISLLLKFLLEMAKTNWKKVNRIFLFFLSFGHRVLSIIHFESPFC